MPNPDCPEYKAMNALVSALAEHASRAKSTVSKWASGSGDTLVRLERGLPITNDRFRRIIQWFSDNWPNDLEWPADIPRPAPSKEAAA